MEYNCNSINKSLGGKVESNIFFMIPSGISLEWYDYDQLEWIFPVEVWQLNNVTAEKTNSTSPLPDRILYIPSPSQAPGQPPGALPGQENSWFKYTQRYKLFKSQIFLTLKGTWRVSALHYPQIISSTSENRPSQVPCYLRLNFRARPGILLRETA